MTTLSQAEYARRVGMSRAAITHWKKAGKLVLQGDQVDVEATDEHLRTYRRAGLPTKLRRVEPVKQGVELGEFDTHLTLADDAREMAASDALRDTKAGMTLEKARLMKETYLARLAQLDYDTKSCRVVIADEVCELVGQEYAKVRTKLLAIPAEHAPAIKRCRTTAEVQEKLSEIVTRTLEELTADKPK